MGETQVAEGPLIQHIPGGYAEWRQKESGLPPARLRSSEGEWWGKLVADPTPTIEEPIVKPEDPDTTKIDTDDTGYQDRINTIADFTAPSKMWDDESIYALEEKLRERLRTTSDIGLGLTAKDLEPVKKPQSPQTPRTLEKGPLPPLPAMPSVPAGPHPQILPPSKFRAGPIRVPAPADDIESLEQGDRFRFFNEPAVKADITASANDVWNILDRGIKFIAGPTAESGPTFNKLFGPRNENERKIFGALKDWWELSGAWRREVGTPLTGGVLFETMGGKTTPRNIMGEYEPAHFPNLPKTLWNFIQGKEHPVVMQEYGDLHLVAIVAHAALAAQYGPVVWTAGGIMTLIPTIIDAINGSVMNKPNLEGNYVQDAAHLAFWVLGNSAIKLWENTVGKITEKLRETPEPKGDLVKDESGNDVRVHNRDTLIHEFEKKIKAGVEYLPKLLKDVRGIPPIKEDKTEVIRDPEFSGLYERDTREGRKGYIDPPPAVSPPFVDFVPPDEPLPDDSPIRVKKFPTGQPTAIPVIEDQPVIYDKDEFKGQPIAGKVQGEIVKDEDLRDRQMADERDRAGYPSPERPKQPLEGDPGGGITGQVTEEPVVEEPVVEEPEIPRTEEEIVATRAIKLEDNLFKSLAQETYDILAGPESKTPPRWSPMVMRFNLRDMFNVYKADNPEITPMEAYGKWLVDSDFFDIKIPKDLERGSQEYKDNIQAQLDVRKEQIKNLNKTIPIALRNFLNDSIRTEATSGKFENADEILAERLDAVSMKALEGMDMRMEGFQDAATDRINDRLADIAEGKSELAAEKFGEAIDDIVNSKFDLIVEMHSDGLVKAQRKMEEKAERAAEAAAEKIREIEIDPDWECWVAREVYGSDDPRWLLFREWMLNDSPNWFHSLYISKGAAFARWLSRNTWLKPLLRRWMDRRI
jgi:hypothetical protein